MKKFLLDTTISGGSAADVSGLAKTVKLICEKLMGPICIVVGAIAAIYAVYLGVMYAKAEDANKRKEVQGRLIGAVIGLVIIIIGITLCYALDWDSIVYSWTNKQ